MVEFWKCLLCFISLLGFGTLLWGIWSWIKFRKEDIYNDNSIGRKQKDEIYQSYFNNSFQL